MTTPSLAKQAERARIYANGAAARKRKSSALRRDAIKLTALALARENQRERSCHYTKGQLQALRG